MLSVLHSSEGRLSGYQVFLGRVNVKYLYKHPMCVCKCLYERLCLCLCGWLCVCVCVRESVSEVRSVIGVGGMRRVAGGRKMGASASTYTSTCLQLARNQSRQTL